MIDVLKSVYGKTRAKFNKGYEHYLTIYLIANVLWIFLAMLLFCYSRNFLYWDISISYIFLFIINAFIIFGLVVSDKVKLEKIDIFLGLLVVFGIISTIFALKPSIAFYGFRNRFEGLFQLFYYYSTLFLGSMVNKDNNKKKIVFTIFIFGVVNVFYCTLQIFDILKFIPIGNRGTPLGLGLITNSNFLGSFMVLCLGLSIGQYIFFNGEKLKNIANYVLCLIFFAGLLMSSALSGMVGLFFIFLSLIVYFIYLKVKKRLNKIMIIKFILLIVGFLCINMFFNLGKYTFMNKDISNFMGETSEIVKGNTNSNFGNGRFYVWGNTLKVVPKYILHGVGIDNFFYAFDGHALVQDYYGKPVFFDKAHNEYLQKLICEGIFSCVVYITMLLVIFVTSTKKIFEDSESNYISIGLFLAFVGYCIQAFFNISVLEVAPFFWLIAGLLYTRKCKENVLKK